jgi:hypothetical protein
MELGRRYIPTDVETKLFPLVIITDEKIPSRIPLIFSGFLVVTNPQVSKQIECLIKSIEAYCGFD